MDRSMRVNFPPDPNPRKPRFDLPPGAWDTHFHVWGPPHLFPYADERPFTPPACPIEHYLMVAAVLGFERGVITQPRVHHHDTSIVVDAIRKSEGRLYGVICADSPIDAATVRALSADGVRGIRIELTESLEGSFDRALFDKTVALAEGAGWSIALHVDSKSLLDVDDLIGGMPVPTIIENYAHIDPGKGLDQPAFRTLMDLAKEPHVWLKTASAYRILRRGVKYEDMVAMAHAVHEASPDRVIWGTDWPHGGVFEPGQHTNDGDIVDMLLDFVPDEEARRKLLVDNPKRLFEGS